MEDLGGVELRARNRTQFPGTATLRDEDRNYVEHKVATTDTLQKIGLFYGVPISEIKRLNNMMTDLEIFALPLVKVPCTRLRLHYLDELHKQQTGHSLLSASGIAQPLVPSLNAPPPTEPARLQPPPVGHVNEAAESTDDDASSSTSSTAKDRIDAILGKTDARVALVRTQLPPSPGLEDGVGRFHFINATAPDSAYKSTLFLIVGVVLMFVVVPLLLTLLEEHNEAEVELRHLHQREHLSHSHVSGG